MNVDINTKMITLLGTPLSQSFAARMQNRGYEAAGLNMLYSYTEVDNTHLGDVIEGLRYMNYAGFAVTKPNKVEVLKYLDELDPLCQKMGSCNTVVKTPEGKLVGYNTDGSGFYLALTEDADIEVAGTSFFCMGSGGAGRAMCSILAYHQAQKIYIMDCFEQAARELVQDINAHFLEEGQEPIAEYVEYGDFSCLKDCQVVINASGVGMGASVGKTPIPKEELLPTHFCYDACYNPDKTQFLLDAEEKGCRIMNGLGMSLYQGMSQIKLWSGKDAPMEAMRQELLDILEEQKQSGTCLRFVRK